MMKKVSKLLLVFGLAMLHSCWPNKLPEFVVSENFESVKEKNGIIIRNITIEKYTIDSNFVAKKNSAGPG